MAEQVTMAREFFRLLWQHNKSDPVKVPVRVWQLACTQWPTAEPVMALERTGRAAYDGHWYVMEVWPFNPVSRVCDAYRNLDLTVVNKGRVIAQAHDELGWSWQRLAARVGAAAMTLYHYAAVATQLVPELQGMVGDKLPMKYARELARLEADQQVQRAEPFLSGTIQAKDTSMFITLCRERPEATNAELLTAMYPEQYAAPTPAKPASQPSADAPYSQVLAAALEASQHVLLEAVERDLSQTEQALLTVGLRNQHHALRAVASKYGIAL